jgi:hypothetical protein
MPSAEKPVLHQDALRAFAPGWAAVSIAGVHSPPTSSEAVTNVKKMLAIVGGVAMGLVCAATLHAQSAAPLNLDLPAANEASSSDQTNPSGPDAPGKYYGDGTDSERLIDRTTVSGSVSTTVGYSKGYGTGFGTDADVDITTQLKNGNTVHMNFDVSRSEGLPYSNYGNGGYRFGPRY